MPARKSKTEATKAWSLFGLDEGFRPSEVFALRWSHVFFNEDGTGLIQVMEGKSKAAHRMLPMTARVYELLRGRHEAIGRPSEGWIFPSSSECGHFTGDAAKDQHKKALTDSGVKAFVPYTLRHTALTNLGEKAGGDVFVLARIAGHSSITVIQRYIHPQADAINRVFAASQSHLGTILGTVKGTPKLERAKDFSVTLRKRLNAKKKLVPGVGVEPLGETDTA
jgi:integrase